MVAASFFLASILASTAFAFPISGSSYVPRDDSVGALAPVDYTTVIQPDDQLAQLKAAYDKVYTDVVNALAPTPATSSNSRRSNTGGRLRRDPSSSSSSSDGKSSVADLVTAVTQTLQVVPKAIPSMPAKYKAQTQADLTTLQNRFSGWSDTSATHTSDQVTALLNAYLAVYNDLKNGFPQGSSSSRKRQELQLLDMVLPLIQNVIPPSIWNDIEDLLGEAVNGVEDGIADAWHTFTSWFRRDTSSVSSADFTAVDLIKAVSLAGITIPSAILNLDATTQASITADLKAMAALLNGLTPPATS